MNHAPPEPRIRSTTRAETARGSVARKSYRRSGLERLGLRRPAALREQAMLVFLRAAGVPVPEPLTLTLGEKNGDTLELRWIDGTVTLDQAWEQAEPRRRRRLARELGTLLRRFHDSGVIHRDLHAGNVLVGADGVLTLIDFHRARRNGSKSARAVDLCALGHHFLSRTRASDRLRFLRAYGAEPRALERAALRSRFAFQRHHERRCDGSGRAFLRLARGVLRVDEHDRELAGRLWLGGLGSGRAIHSGGDARSTRVDDARLPFPLFVKAFDDRGSWKRLLRGSRARRAWRNLFRLAMAGLPTPRTVAFTENAGASLRPSSLLVTEFVPRAETLLAHVTRGGVKTAWPRLEALAAALARLHDEGLSHRDLKAENLLVPEGAGPIVFIDADGVTRRGLVAPERAARDLMRLNASFRDARTVTWRDRLAFLVAYRRARVLFRPRRRDLWRATARMTRAKWQNAPHQSNRAGTR